MCSPDSGFHLGTCGFGARDTGALFLAPSGESGSKLALVLMGGDSTGMRDIVSLATPTIPPMTRSPVRNLQIV